MTSTLAWRVSLWSAHSFVDILAVGFVGATEIAYGKATGSGYYGTTLGDLSA